jgi:hypothetical protein
MLVIDISIAGAYTLNCRAAVIVSATQTVIGKIGI